MAAISIGGLTKLFGRTKALDGLDLTVNDGEVHGFLGPNESGKTTTIRILLGLLRADSGQARLLGGDPWRDVVALHRRLAYVPGDVTLWPSLSGGEVIDLLGRLRGGLDQQRRAELLERFDPDPRKKARTYSKGNRQKVALVAALTSDAELLLLDEPTTGLNPLMGSVFRQCIEEVKQEGRTILLSSHILAEVEALCDRISIIRLGRTVESGTLAELRHLPAPRSPPSWPPRPGVALVYLPAVWLVIALAVVGFGWLPRIAAALAWAAVGYCAIVALFGDSFELPAWFQQASPFTHTPQAPLEAVTAAPLLAIGVIVVLLVAAGLAGFRRRDLGY